MKITILSQNLASIDINDNHNDIFTDTFNKIKPDIYVEFTQEDNREINDSSLIDNRLLDGYNNLCVEALSPKQHFNIITKVYSNSDTFIKNKSGHVEINKFSGTFTSGIESTLGRLIKYATKGASWVLIKNTSNPNINILFVNLHLPIDTGKFSFFKNASLGNKYRVQSMVSCLKIILKEIKDTLDIKYLKIFIGGDLNFRVIDGIDQLSLFLEEDAELSEKTFPFIELSNNLGSTCKYLPTCDIDRTDKEECLDSKRSPSRCDRILTNVPLSNLKILKENNFVMNPLLDHNAIILSVYVSELHRVGINRFEKKPSPNKESPNEGGRYKKTRKYKKTKKFKKTKKYITTRKKL